MKLTLIYIISVLLICCNNTQNNKKDTKQKTNLQNKDSAFEYHFRILDSVVKINLEDSVYACCSPSIKFMEINTGIESRSNGTLLGKLYFSKSDLRKWHEWYDKEYGKK